jgi:hypothetical protein
MIRKWHYKIRLRVHPISRLATSFSSLFIDLFFGIHWSTFLCTVAPVRGDRLFGVGGQDFLLLLIVRLLCLNIFPYCAGCRTALFKLFPLLWIVGLLSLNIFPYYATLVGKLLLQQLSWHREI